MTTATSLAESTVTALIAVSTGTVSPGFNPSLVGNCAAACVDVVSSVSSVTLPLFSARKGDRASSFW